MSLTKEDVQKVARLSSLDMSDEEMDRLAPELNNILGFIEKLGEVDTDNVEPLASPVDGIQPLREDIVNDGAMPDKVLANAPEKQQGFYVVKKIVE